jgi:dUTP pyrophosphatase
MIDILMKRMTSQAKLFSKAHKSDACFDIFALEDDIVEAFETKLVHTGIKMSIPQGYEGIIRPRSGMSLKTSLRVANSPGTIDSGYRGEVCVVMTNLSNRQQIIEKHQRIAQFTIKKVEAVNIVEVDEITETERGENGFGSTGL